MKPSLSGLSVRNSETGVTYQLEPLRHVVMKVVYSQEEPAVTKKISRTPVAGKIGESGFKDGKVPASRLHNPTTMFMAADHKALIIVDEGNGKVRNLRPRVFISTPLRHGSVAVVAEDSVECHRCGGCR
jgi:hypothetical protein